MSSPYNITDTLAGAIRTAISIGQNAFAGANIRTNRSDVSAVASRIEVDVTNVSRASLQMANAPGYGWFYNHYQAQVDILVATDRDESASAGIHDDGVQVVRYIMSHEAQAFAPNALTVCEVLHIEETGESHEVVAETREDHSRLSYRMEIGLLPSAYSAPTSALVGISYMTVGGSFFVS